MKFQQNLMISKSKSFVNIMNFENISFIILQNPLLNSLYKFDFGFKKPKIWVSHFNTKTILNEQQLIFLKTSGLSNAHPKRKIEYIASRELIKLALSYEYSISVVIKKGKNGEPLWPENYNGSISHNKKYSAIIIADKNWIIGIDIESILSNMSTNSIINIIFNQNEKNIISTYCSSQINFFVTIIFSAKETLYKAFYKEEYENFSIRVFEFIKFSYNNTLIFKLTNNTPEDLYHYKDIMVNYSIFNEEVITWFSLER